MDGLDWSAFAGYIASMDYEHHGNDVQIPPLLDRWFEDQREASSKNAVDRLPQSMRDE